MDNIDNYFAAKKAVLSEFKYVSDWQKYPLDDCRSLYWKTTTREVYFGENKDDVINEDGDCYSNSIIRVKGADEHGLFKTSDYTLIPADPHYYGNQFLCIFSNDKRVF